MVGGKPGESGAVKAFPQASRSVLWRVRGCRHRNGLFSFATRTFATAATRDRSQSGEGEGMTGRQLVKPSTDSSGALR